MCPRKCNGLKKQLAWELLTPSNLTIGIPSPTCNPQHLFFLSSPHVQVCPFPLVPTWRLTAGGGHIVPSPCTFPDQSPQLWCFGAPFQARVMLLRTVSASGSRKTGADWSRAPRAWHNHGSENLPPSLQSQFFSALFSGQSQSFVVVFVPQLNVHAWRNHLDESTPLSSTLGPSPLMEVWVTLPPLARFSSEDAQPLVLFP